VIEIASPAAGDAILANWIRTALYYGDPQRRMRSCTTGRPVMILLWVVSTGEAPRTQNKALSGEVESVMLFIDIDHLKMIVGMRAEAPPMWSVLVLRMPFGKAPVMVTSARDWARASSWSFPPIAI
jgi:hypothetical protein